MSLAILRNELLTDPLGIGYASKTDQQCYASLTALTRTRQRSMSTTDLLAWSANNLRFITIQAAANSATLNQKKNLASIMMVLLTNPDIPLDMRLSASTALVNGLVSTNVLAQADADALTSAASESISRYTELGIPEYQAGDIATARA